METFKEYCERMRRILHKFPKDPTWKPYIVIPFKQEFNPALEGGLTTMEVSMKEEALKEHASAVEAAAGALYDAGFADGKVSVEVPVDTTPFSKEDVDLAVSEATEVLKAKVSELETKLSQKDADALEEAIADQLAELAQKLRDRTVKAVDPVPEVTEETKGTDAQP